MNNMFKRIGVVLSLAVVIVALSIGPAFAANSDNNGHKGGKDSSTTTLDACGYFGGTQTVSETKDYVVDGVTYHSEKGTWTGILNNYSNTPVASLGTVKGSYSETYTIDANGMLTGTENFNSGAGKIDQTFSYNSITYSDFSVSVEATRDLSFLTSDTNGHCYTGTFPRP